MSRNISILLIMGLLIMGGVVTAQDEMGDMAPAVTVSDQVSVDGSVTVDSVTSPGLGFIVIHAEGEGGGPGPVIGFRKVLTGTNTNVNVPIDTANATTTLFAMLHEDTGEPGVYEFGQVEGADAPVIVDGAPVSPPFGVELLSGRDQFVEGSVLVDVVVTSQDGFVVVHQEGENGGPGAVIGNAPVTAGRNVNVEVPVEGDITSTVYPMLHVDTGEAGVYEFGQVEGADLPVAVDGTVAVFGLNTAPSIRVPDQIVLGGDARIGEEFNPSLIADSVLSDGPGWLVVHANNEGAPGAVLGFAPVSDGYNAGVVVELDTEGITPTLFPMLHVDTGEEGTYEFGQVEGADSPVTVDGNVVTFPIEGAPSIVYEGTLDGSTLTVEQALIDAEGWLVIHADNEGAPGAVLGFAPIVEGLNADVAVQLDEEGMTDTVFPMLHYDTGESGVYEFGQVEGADGPVVVQGNVITGPLTPGEGME